MFIFDRPFSAIAAGLGVAFLGVCLDRVSQSPEARGEFVPWQPEEQEYVSSPSGRESSDLVRDASPSCGAPPAPASWFTDLSGGITHERAARRQRDRSSSCTPTGETPALHTAGRSS